MARFCEWAKKNPTELLALKADTRSKEAEKLLDTFVSDEKTGFPNSVKFTIVTSVKSFYKANYANLASASGAMTLEKVKPYNKLAKESLRKLWLWAPNQRDKALLTMACSTAIAKETLVNLTWGHLEADWEQKELPCINIPSELLKGHGHGRYKGVQQITFLTPEAKRDLLNYREWIEAKVGRKLTPEDNIFLEIATPYGPLRYGRLGTLMWHLSHDSGIPFSWHDARRVVNTALESIGISPNWARKIRGRKVKGEEAPYSQPAIEQLRDKFREAVPLLEFTVESQPASKEVEERLKALEEYNKSLTPEQKELRKRAGVQFRTAMQAEEAAERFQKHAKKCKDSEHCEEFSQIPEVQLLAHLKDGWQIVKELSNGEVIVKRVL